MKLLLNAEVKEFIFLCFLTSYQYIDWVGPDMGLGVKVGDPDIHQEIGAPIKVASDEKI